MALSKLSKNLILIQARMASKRLPGKVLKKIKGKELLLHLFYSLSKIDQSQIVICTTRDSSDNKIVKFCKKMNIKFFRGSNNNVAKRLLDAAKKFRFKNFVRICGDSPVLDHKLVLKAIKFKNRKKFDLITNCYPRTSHHGHSVEIINTSSLEKILKKKVSKLEKEHVTSYFYNNKENFKILNFNNNKLKKILNFSVDSIEDFKKIKKYV